MDTQTTIICFICAAFIIFSLVSLVLFTTKEKENSLKEIDTDIDIDVFLEEVKRDLRRKSLEAKGRTEKQEYQEMIRGLEAKEKNKEQEYQEMIRAADRAWQSYLKKNK